MIFSVQARNGLARLVTGFRLSRKVLAVYVASVLLSIPATYPQRTRRVPTECHCNKNVNATVVSQLVVVANGSNGIIAPPTGDGDANPTRPGSPGPWPAPTATGAIAGAGSRAGSAPGQAARPPEGRQATRWRALFLGVGTRQVGGPHHGQQGQGPEGQRHVPVPAVRAAHLESSSPVSCLAASKACSMHQTLPATATSVSRSQPCGAKAT